MMAYYAGRYVGADRWQDVAMGSVPVKTQGKEEESVRESCVYVI